MGIYKPVSPLSDSVQGEMRLVCPKKVMLREYVTVHIIPSQGDNVYKLEAGSLLNNYVTILYSIILQLILSYLGLNMIGIGEHICNLSESWPRRLVDTPDELPDTEKKNL